MYGEGFLLDLLRALHNVSSWHEKTAFNASVLQGVKYFYAILCVLNIVKLSGFDDSYS